MPAHVTASENGVARRLLAIRLMDIIDADSASKVVRNPHASGHDSKEGKRRHPIYACQSAIRTTSGGRPIANG
jgi:hypothetical protein